MQWHIPCFISSPDLCSSVNECIESLCYHMEPDPERKSYTKDTLHSSLPDINCTCHYYTCSFGHMHCMCHHSFPGGLEKSLEFLTQRGGSLACPALQAHSSTLSQTQRAVLALLYYSHVHCSRYVALVYSRSHTGQLCLCSQHHVNTFDAARTE